MNGRTRLFFRIKLYLFLGLFFLLLILGVAAVRWLPLLHFQEIRAFDDREQSVAASSFLISLLHDPLVRLVGEDSMLLWLASAARLYPLSLPNVEITIDWWNRHMTIRPAAQTRALIWCTTEYCFWVDDRGIVLDSAPDVDGQLVRRVSTNVATMLATGSRILSLDMFQALISIFGFLEAGGVSISSATFDERLSDLTIVTNNDALLLFNLRFDAVSTLSSFADVTKSINVVATRSIDFRVPQKIYYVPKS